MTGSCRYFALLSGWLALFALPTFAGDWWDSHYNVYQALTSLAVIAMARKLYPSAHWADYLAVVAMLQIIHAAADVIQPGDEAIYNWIQASYNMLEVMFLAIGGISEWINGRFYADGHSGAGNHSDSGKQERGRHA
jgi:hypothetical protein